MSMRLLLRLVVLAAAIAGLVWLVQRHRLDQASREAKGRVGSVIREAKKALSDLDVDEIAGELRRTGRVVRRKAGTAVRGLADATEDARTTAAIKARLALDPKLSALAITVDTTHGRVTLAGLVDSPEDVARAIQLALEEDDVHEVISTLQVRTADHRSPPRKVTSVR
jgi:osmotically-inducible protein OsmY